LQQNDIIQHFKSKVNHEQAEDAIEIDSDDEDDDKLEPVLSTAEMLQHARLLENACLSSGVESPLEVLQVM
jgi:hypothetical protein